MKILLLAILSLFITPVFAVGIGNDNPPGGGGGIQAQTQGQAQGQIQGQGQAQFSNSDSRARAQAYVAGSTINVNPAPVTVTTNEAKIPESTRNEQVGTVNVRSVPNVFAGNVYPTTNCAHSSTVGAAGLGWGVSIGSSYLDEECSLRETSRSFAGMGMKDDALHVLCSSKFSAAAPSCKAISQAQSAPRPEQQEPLR